MVSLADHEQHARQQLDDNAGPTSAAGRPMKSPLRANRSAWDALTLWPRVLRPWRAGTPASACWAARWPPHLAGPIAFQRMAHPDGELATAYAAAALGAGLVLSTQASVPLEPIAQAVLSDPGRGPLWFQLYLQHDRASPRPWCSARKPQVTRPWCSPWTPHQRHPRPGAPRRIPPAARHRPGEPCGPAARARTATATWAKRTV